MKTISRFSLRGAAREGKKNAEGRHESRHSAGIRVALHRERSATRNGPSKRAARGVANDGQLSRSVIKTPPFVSPPLVSPRWLLIAPSSPSCLLFFARAFLPAGAAPYTRAFSRATIRFHGITPRTHSPSLNNETNKDDVSRDSRRSSARSLLPFKFSYASRRNALVCYAERARDCDFIPLSS